MAVPAGCCRLSGLAKGADTDNAGELLKGIEVCTPTAALANAIAGVVFVAAAGLRTIWTTLP